MSDQKVKDLSAQSLLMAKSVLQAYLNDDTALKELADLNLVSTSIKDPEKQIRYNGPLPEQAKLNLAILMIDMELRLEKK